MKQLLLLLAIAASAWGQISSFPPSSSSAGASPAGSAGNQQIKHDASTFGASTVTGNTAGATYEDSPILALYKDITAALPAGLVPLDMQWFGPFLAVSGANGSDAQVTLMSVNPNGTANNIVSVTAAGKSTAWGPLLDFGKYLYFGTSKFDGADCIESWDISVSPAVLKSCWVPPDHGAIYSWDLKGDYAYIATNFPPSGNSHLYKVDYTNKSSPQEVSEVEIGLYGAGAGTSKLLVVDNAIAYVGVLPETPGADPSLYIINTDSMTVLSTVVFPDTDSSGGGSLAIDGTTLFVGIAGNIPFVSGACVPATGLHCRVRVFNVKNPAAPSIVTGFRDNETYPGIEGFSLINRHLSVGWAGPITGTVCASAQCELEIFDVSNLASIALAAGYDVPAGVATLSHSGKLLAYGDVSNNLILLEIPGLRIPGIDADTVASGDIQSRRDISAQGVIKAATGMAAGPQGFDSQGPIAGTILKLPNCADSAGAAACSSYPAGAFVVDAASTSTVVSTTAVTAKSRIFIQEDSSLAAELGVTCNTQSSLTLGALRVTARTAGTSFTVTTEAAPTTNPMCVSYWIIN